MERSAVPRGLSSQRGAVYLVTSAAGVGGGGVCMWVPCFCASPRIEASFIYFLKRVKRWGVFVWLAELPAFKLKREEDSLHHTLWNTKETFTPDVVPALISGAIPKGSRGPPVCANKKQNAGMPTLLLMNGNN